MGYLRVGIQTEISEKDSELYISPFYHLEELITAVPKWINECIFHPYNKHNRMIFNKIKLNR